MLLIFDADDEIVGDIILPNKVDVEGYNLQFGAVNSMIYCRMSLINNKKKWRYRAILHEFMECLEKEPRYSILTGNYFIISGRTGNRNLNPNKYYDDAIKLENAHKEAVESNDDLHLRYAFYCANSYRDCGRLEDAIKWYKITLSQENWTQEKYISCLEIYRCYKKLNQIENSLYYLVEGIKYDKQRLECVYYLVDYYYAKSDYHMAYNYYNNIKEFYENDYLNTESYSDKLFIQTDIGTLLLPYCMIVATDKVKKGDNDLDMFKVIQKMYEIVFTKKCMVDNKNYISNLL